MRHPNRYVFFSENACDSVVETFGDIWDLHVRPFGVVRSGVFLVVLRMLSFVYDAFGIPVETKDVVKCILVLPVLLSAKTKASK